ncbi:hypothetical protein PAXRUDRAFT_33189 [Paxillus rubicundulus Ve08.2h10]|uniref:Uncharacterized protein n=1 Tax=Paxillus rubicundulus Ve08.2h10 TaxID=930991 RepID=A0A0D0E2U7_9AGAM|nr:hypothetical protein PAXRUDRAFT_33189 [Paxillus rubicundulus Ve08.2h10]
MHFNDPKSPERLSELDPGVWETDLFDDSTARFLLRKLASHPEGEDILDYVDQLVFMSRSVHGREAIQKVTDGLEMIRRLMQNTDTKIRLSGIVICCELGQSIQECDITFIITMLNSDDTSEQIRVCSALPSLIKDSHIRAKLLNEETLKILTKLCRTKDNDHLKRQCAQCLALLVVHAGVPALIVEIEAVNDIRDLLDDTHNPIVVSALELLASLAADETASPVLANTLLLPRMIRLAEKHDERVARAAVTAILALARSSSDILRKQANDHRETLLSIFNAMAQQTELIMLQQVGREATRTLTELCACYDLDSGLFLMHPIKRLSFPY